MADKPTILTQKVLTRTRLFGIEEIQLRFANGTERTYERMMTPKLPGVIIVALTEDQQVMLIREYAAGFEDYLLSLPKGARDPEESYVEAANRELMEEVGMGAEHLECLKLLSLSPGYMGHQIAVVLAEGLYERRLDGDEPEPLEVSRFPLARLDELVAREDFHEARALAALYMVRDRKGL